MVVWLLSQLALAGCPPTALSEAVSDAEKAFVAMEASALDRAHAEARGALDCQEQPLTPVLCAGVHRVEALKAFVDGDDDATILSFQAMLDTQPGYDLPDELAPPGSPLRDTLDQARQFDTSEPFPLPLPAEGWLTVDGRRAIAAPSGRPFVFQRMLDDGAVAQTAYVPLGKPFPRYPLRDVGSGAEPEQPSARSGKGLLVAGAALAIVGAGAYGTAFATRGAYTSAVAEGDADRIESTHRVTNLLTVGGLVGLAGGGTLVLVGAF
jgi:hypothetical protein